MENLMSIKEVAWQLDMSGRDVRWLVEFGMLESRKIGILKIAITEESFLKRFKKIDPELIRKWRGPWWLRLFRKIEVVIFELRHSL